MPNLADILKDPNYINANAETKKAIFDKYSVQDTNYTGANAETQAAIRQRFGVETQQTEPPKDYQRKPVDAIDAAFREESPSSFLAMRNPKEALQGAKEAAATTVQVAPQIVGGIYGGIPGAIAGGTLGRQASSALGLSPEESMLTSAGYATGTELGGRLVGKGVEKVIGAGGKIVEKVTGKGPAKPATVEELKQAETQAWDKFKASTTTFKDPVPLKDKVDEILSPKGYNYDPDNFPALDTALKKFETVYTKGLKGKAVDIHEMRALRTSLQKVQMGVAGRDEKSLAGDLIEALDDYVMQYGGKDAVAWKEARDVSNQLFRSRDVQNIVKAAEESSKTTSTEIRSQFKDILNSNKLKMYSPEQQAVIKQIADGTATEKTFELIGKMAPKSATWNALLALLNAPVLVGSMASRGAANALAKGRVNMLDELIRGGQIPQTIQLPQTTQRLFPAGVNALANQLQGQQ
jgi:hypothetical protein